MLTGNTILITGGSSGVGLQLAKVLLSQGNTVLICGRWQAKLSAAETLLPHLHTFCCDLSRAEERIALFHWVKERHPTCNILINNAALVHVSDFLQEADAYAQAELEFQTNVLAPIHLSKLLLPLLLMHKSPILINIGTGLVYVPRVLYPFYNATKAALHSFTQVLRSQLQDSKIRIVEVLLPAIDTPWHRGNPPKIAISAEQAVGEMLEKMERGQEEIRVGKVTLLYWLSRIAPHFAFRKLNSNTG